MTGINTWVLYSIAVFGYIVGAFVGWSGFEYYSSTGNPGGILLAAMIVGIGICFSGLGYLQSRSNKPEMRPTGI